MTLVVRTAAPIERRPGRRRRRGASLRRRGRSAREQWLGGHARHARVVRPERPVSGRQEHGDVPHHRGGAGRVSQQRRRHGRRRAAVLERPRRGCSGSAGAGLGRDGSVHGAGGLRACMRQRRRLHRPGHVPDARRTMRPRARHAVLYGSSGAAARCRARPSAARPRRRSDVLGARLSRRGRLQGHGHDDRSRIRSRSLPRQCGL